MSRARMSRTIALAAALLSLAPATRALAATYPPGPQGCCPDTLTIVNLQNTLAIPHPTSGDVVLGVGGVITAFAQQVRPYGFYMQMKDGQSYSGVGVFTGNVDHGPGSAQNLQIGDSVVVYGKVKSFDGAVAIGALGGDNLISALPLDVEDSQDLVVRVVSHGNPLPPFHSGSLADFSDINSNPLARPWDGMLVRLGGPLKVARIVNLPDDDGLVSATNTEAVLRGFLVVSPSCTGVCDTVMVDCTTLTSFDPPPVGTILGFVQGVLDQRDVRHRIFLRGPNDVSVGNPPLATDAFPIYDNDLPGGQRRDSVMVVFDRAVDKTSAENAGNYALASNGTVDGAHRLDAPDDNRVVLQIRNGLNDGVTEALTVANVKSLSDGTPMSSPQTFSFLNGVLELDEIRAPDPTALAGNPCLDRSRFSGAGSSPGLRASFTGTVTGAFGSAYTLQGATLTRGGLWVQSPGFALTTGHGVILVGALAEVSGETQGLSLVYARDLGPATVPGSTTESIHVLIDDACDASQLFLNGQDLDGMLVTLDRVAIVASEPAGASFYVGTPGSSPAFAALRARPAFSEGAQEQILIAALGGNFSFAANAGRIVTITGVLGRVGGTFAVFPLGDGSIHDFGPVPTFSLPLNVSKSATASKDPDIVLGSDGTLFMSWDRVFNESVHSLSLDNTLNWSAPLPVLHQGIQPAVARTPSNKFCVIASSTDSLFFKQSTDGGLLMDPLVSTVDHVPTAFPALSVGLGEHLHAAWERPGSGIFYSRSLTGGSDFSNPIPIVLDTIPYATNSMARICASQGDNVYVFWQFHQPGEPNIDKVLYSRSLDGGVTFTRPRLVRDESNPLTSTVKLAILGDAQTGPDGTVYVMGLQAGGPNDSIAFLRSTNNGFTFALVGHPTAPALTGICPKSFAVGADGSIHALIGICGTALFYTRSMDGGATWGPAVNVTDEHSSAVGEPRGAKIILDGQGKPVVVWYAPVGGSTEIFSSKLLN